MNTNGKMDEKSTPAGMSQRDDPTTQSNPSIAEGQTIKDYQDEALNFVSAHAVGVDEITNKGIRHKIDLYILPWMCGLYMLQYLDKTSLSYASSMNLKVDTNINSSQYSW
jgi:ACS family allantoate permease-like MFS transporter